MSSLNLQDGSHQLVDGQQSIVVALLLNSLLEIDLALSFSLPECTFSHKISRTGSDRCARQTCTRPSRSVRGPAGGSTYAM